MKRLFAFLLLVLPLIAFTQTFGSTALAQSIAMLKKQAANGDANAQSMLGKAYNSGRGVPQDYAEAYFWYDLAAAGKMGNSKREVITKLRGEVAAHLTKEVISQEQARALIWFDAHEALATTVKDSSAPTRSKSAADPPQSFISQYWTQKLAAPSKPAPDENSLPKRIEATSSSSPSGAVETSEQKRAAAVRRAAEQGKASAQYDLGLMYASGIGVPQDYTQAANWLRKAAEQGDAGAEQQLGDLYVSGHGVPQDNAQAQIWLSKAAGQNPLTNTPATSLTVMVLQAESVPYTVESDGEISTNCNISGSANTSGYANTFGNTTFGNATTNSNMHMNCNSYDRTIRWQHVMNTMFVEASDGNAYIIACDRAWRWSKCVPLRAGDRFSARFTGKGIDVEGLNAKGKEVSTTYRILQSKSLH